MTDDNWKTLRVPPEAYDEAKEQKEAAGRTWGEQVVRQNDDTNSDVDELIDTIAAEVGGPQVDDSEIAREVARHIDYAELATRVADEVEGRMR